MAKNCTWLGVDDVVPAVRSSKTSFLDKPSESSYNLFARFAVLCWSTPVSMERSGIFVAAAARQEQTR
jgi:hypothetical protein